MQDGVAYRAVYTCSSERPCAEATAETEGMPSRAFGPHPSTTTTQQAGQPPQAGVRHFHSDDVRAEAVQAEAAETGYLPAAVAFVMGKLQVRPSPIQRLL